MKVLTYQLFVLTLFCEKDELTYGEIIENIVINENVFSSSSYGTSIGATEAVKAALASMMTHMIPLFSMEPKCDDFSSASMIRLNKSYVANFRKFSIPRAEANIAEVENMSMPETVMEQRKHVIYSAIVRVVKQQKKPDHQMLFCEVTRICNPVFETESFLVTVRFKELVNKKFLLRKECSENR